MVSTNCRIVSTVAILAWIACSQPVLGQDRDVVIAVRTPGNMSAQQLEQRFRNAVESALGTKQHTARIQAKDMDPETYEKIKEFLTTVQIQGAVDPNGTFARRSTKSELWDIYLPDGYNSIQDLEIQYREMPGGQVKTETFQPKPKLEVEKDPTQRLTFRGFAPPQAQFRAEPGWEVVGYTVRCKPNAGKPEKSFTGSLQPDKCFRLEVGGYPGSIRELFEALGDKKRVGVAMVGLQPPKTLALGLADLVSPIIPLDGDWYQNIFRYRVTPPVDPKPDRAWVLFPLSRDQAAKLKDELRPAKISDAEIADALLAGKLAGFDVSKEDVGNVSLKANELPKWQQLNDLKPDDKDAATEFSRQFVLEKSEDWKNHPCRDEAWRVLMFEYDVRDKNGVKTGGKAILETKLINDMSKNTEASFIHVHQVQGWATEGSPLRADAPPAPPAAPVAAP